MSNTKSTSRRGWKTALVGATAALALAVTGTGLAGTGVASAAGPRADYCGNGVVSPRDTMSGSPSTDLKGHTCLYNPASGAFF